MYTAHDGTGVTHFAGVQHEVNHTSETQLQGWKDVIHEMCTMYNECMIGAMTGVENPRELVTKVKGMLTDHVEDQKKLVHLFREWKEVCEREVRGKQALATLPPDNVIALLWQTTEGAIVAAGGIEGWESVDFFVWAGCCMHKDLNAVKGGNTHMQAWWRHNGVDGLVLLMNHDNAAAASGGPSTAQARAVTN
jgi:hypothetical protein